MLNIFKNKAFLNPLNPLKVQLSRFNFRNFTMGIPIYSHEFKSRGSRNDFLILDEPGNSQRGIFQGKRHGRGNLVSYSEVQ